MRKIIILQILLALFLEHNLKGQEAELSFASCEIITAEMTNYRQKPKTVSFLLEKLETDEIWLRTSIIKSGNTTASFKLEDEGRYRVTILPWIEDNTFTKGSTFKMFDNHFKSSNSNDNGFISNEIDWTKDLPHCQSNTLLTSVDIFRTDKTISITNTAPKDLNKNINYFLTDLSGKSLMSGAITSFVSFDASHLIDGVYLLTLVSDTEMKTVKLPLF